MRFALAVIAAACADQVAYLRSAEWNGASLAAPFAYVLFAAVGAGWLAARRSALAGALSVLVAAALFAVVSLFYPYRRATLGDLAALELYYLVNFNMLALAIYAALAGALGGWLRGRALRRAQERIGH